MVCSDDKILEKIMGCYMCNKQILKEPLKGEKTYSVLCYGNKMAITEDYTMLDVFLSNGKAIVAFAVPVCRGCCKKTIENNDLSNLDSFKELIIEMVQKGNTGPKPFIDDKNLDIIKIKDLTDELVKEGILCH